MGKGSRAGTLYPTGLLYPLPCHQRAQPNSESSTHPGAASIPPGTSTAATEPRSALRHPTRAALPAPRGPLHAFSPQPGPPLPACTVRRRRRKAAAQPQLRRVAPGRLSLAMAVAGASAGCGTRCAPGVYVGHAPSRPRSPHRLVETGTGCYHGNGFQPPCIPP